MEVENTSSHFEKIKAGVQFGLLWAWGINVLFWMYCVIEKSPLTTKEKITIMGGISFLSSLMGIGLSYAGAWNSNDLNGCVTPPQEVIAPEDDRGYASINSDEPHQGQAPRF